MACGKSGRCGDVKDGKVRKVIIGYKYDTNKGERLFRLVERPVRECVKLLNIEDTTLLEEIEVVRNASKEILGYHVNWHPRQDVTCSLTTYACNTVSTEGYYKGCSTDIGYKVPRLANVATDIDSYDYEEKKLQIDEDNDIFFDNDNDENFYDCYDDVYLL